MTAKSADVIVRLLAKDEGLREALKGAGKDGEKALKAIDRASKKAGPGLKAVDNVAIDLKKSLSNALDTLGPLGSALKGLGPIGLAAGAALAVTVGAARAAAKAGEDAAKKLAQIEIDADKIGVSTDALQALRFELSGVIQNENELTSALQAANKTTSEAALGTGEFYSNLARINPEMVKNVQNADSLKDRLEAVRDGYNQAGGEVERNSILLRTFGDNGVAVGRALLELEGGIDGAIESAKSFGVVQDESLIKASAEAAEAIEKANLRIEASMTSFKVRFSGLAVAAKETYADIINTISGGAGKNPLQREFDKLIKDLAFKGANPKRLERIAELAVLLGKAKKEAEELADAEAKAASASANNASLRAAYNKLIDEATTATERRAEALEKLDAIRAAGFIDGGPAEYDRLRNLIVEKYKDVDAIRAQEKAARDFEKAAQDAARAREKGIELLSRSSTASDAAGAVTQKVAAYQADLTDNMAAYGLTLDQVGRLVTQYRENLDGTAKAKETLNSAMQGILDPVARFQAETKALQAAQALANIDHDKFNALMMTRKELLGELRQAASDQAETEEFGETLAAAETRIKDSLKSASQIIDEKVELQRKIIEALGGQLSDDEASAFLAKYRKDLEKTAAKTDELSASQEGLIDIINASSGGWDSLGKTALQVLQDMIIKSIQANNTIGAGGVGGFFGSLASSLFGGGSSAASAISVPVNHTGKAVVGSAGGARRLVDPSIFIQAPRHHSGTASIGSDEVPMIAQKGERIFSNSQNNDLIAAINSRGGAAITAPTRFIVNNYGNDTITTEEREGEDGQKELIATIGKQMKGVALQTLSSREGKSAMQATYGLKPRVGAR